MGAKMPFQVQLKRKIPLQTTNWFLEEDPNPNDLCVLIFEFLKEQIKLANVYYFGYRCSIHCFSLSRLIDNLYLAFVDFSYYDAENHRLQNRCEEEFEILVEEFQFTKLKRLQTYLTSNEPSFREVSKAILENDFQEDNKRKKG